jgi:glc operon protein GlcG
LRRNAILQAGIVGFLALSLAQSLYAQLAAKKTLTLEAARKIAAAAEAEARKNNWTVVIAIVDDGSNLLYLERMDGTQLGSIEIAQFKARSAVKFKRPTKDFGDRLKSGESYLLKVPDLAPFEGGVPIMLGTECIGGIGVSGMTSQQDGVVAAAGLAVAAKMQ